VVALLIAGNLLIGTITASHHTGSTQRVGSSAAQDSGDITTTTTKDGFASSGPNVTSPDSSDTSTPVTSDSATAATTTSPQGGGGSGPALTTTTALAAGGPDCHNSHDPACGDFSWSPQPTNSHPSVTVTSSPDPPRAGQTLTLDVTITDAESVVGSQSPCWGDSTACVARTDYNPTAGVGYGPWSPPVPAQHTFHDGTHFTHTYSAAGTYTVKLLVATQGYGYKDDCPGDPSRPDGQGAYHCIDPFLESFSYTFQITVNP
jgi:hypothetical protein